MLLKEIERICDCKVKDELKSLKCSGLAYDSRHVKEGFLFFAIKGLKTDGSEYVDEAFNKKAIAVVSEDCTNKKNCIKVDCVRKCMGKIANVFYGEPSKDLSLVGITGTNGKTTTTYLLKAIFKDSGVVGTTGYFYENVKEKLANTTPESIDINEILVKMKPFVNYVFMEVSAHAVTFSRIEGLDFKLKIFTNLSQDHLDFYKTMKNYAQAKRKFFKENDYRVINIDDNLGKTLYKKGYSITYASKNADIFPIDYSYDIKGLNAKLSVYGDTFNINSNLIGLYNIYNIMAAVGASVYFGKSKNEIEESIANFTNVPGRLEKFIKNDICAVVDYAHTDDAIKNVLSTLETITKGKLIVVFGAGGDRDKTKRQKMGAVAEQFAYVIILTNDNPRSEDPDLIIADILKGITMPEKIIIEKDRKLAIIRALEYASANDVIAILGKGHEDYQIIGDKVYHFSDAEVVKDWMQSV